MTSPPPADPPPGGELPKRRKGESLRSTRPAPPLPRRTPPSERLGRQERPADGAQAAADHPAAAGQPAVTGDDIWATRTARRRRLQDGAATGEWQALAGPPAGTGEMAPGTGEMARPGSGARPEREERPGSAVPPGARSGARAEGAARPTGELPRRPRRAASLPPTASQPLAIPPEALRAAGQGAPLSPTASQPVATPAETLGGARHLSPTPPETLTRQGAPSAALSGAAPPVTGPGGAQDARPSPRSAESPSPAPAGGAGSATVRVLRRVVNAVLGLVLVAGAVAMQTVLLEPDDLDAPITSNGGVADTVRTAFFEARVESVEAASALRRQDRDPVRPSPGQVFVIVKVSATASSRALRLESAHLVTADGLKYAATERMDSNASLSGTWVQPMWRASGLYFFEVPAAALPGSRFVVSEKPSPLFGDQYLPEASIDLGLDAAGARGLLDSAKNVYEVPQR